MELCSFWVVSPADGQKGSPEPVKLVFFENGDINVISLSEECEFRGAYRLPVGSYSYTGDALMVSNENFNKIRTLVKGSLDEGEYRSQVLSEGLVTDMEWGLFYASPAAWKSLRIVVITFGDE
jgi:hypothetical protein